MIFTTQELVTEFADVVLQTHGKHTQFDRSASPDQASASCLIFLQSAELLPPSAAVIITSVEVANKILDHTDSFIVCVADLRLAQSAIKRRYDPYLNADLEWDAIHPSAVIHASARLGTGCRIGPNAVIGSDCILGDRVIVRATSVLEHQVVIGDDSVIHSGVNLGYGTHIGKRCVVQSGSVIASEGFGFAPDASGQYHPIPHTGVVVLEDDVHVGANSCIDRGTFGETRLRRGVKIDNLVHIAHNVEVGENTVLTAQTAVAGSSKIGKQVIASGQTGVLDHKNVADGAILLHRCGVTEDIPSAGMWAGTPARPLKEYVRNLALGKKVARLEKTLKTLQARLDDDS
ncbi:UDP-3-O-(3-hydroxymyristoyl)glucosamine N-acyltransferase [Arenicella xantha]|uniref:UDP-3-O-[3-hydroxymyristoyl] glucosamine N-acyltransferase n=1 Tax=Arenicella xantha TaxID=644221 RepID=A0A395JIC7_9GAMM|nr:UDP-3-O-(3-hydroxymyristoyl)glucosamine N-acyltransferase [Arenicella xantha]RBP48697.1 UDP-3-O-[3-hydroxymyristoyl] glucosamine N-acyltransferase [Arenicella xantha]